MANYSLKTMGSTLDALSILAGRCVCCPVEIGVGDWYYDPTRPDRIMQRQQSDTPLVLTLTDGMTLDNEASGITYRYDETEGMIPTGFVWADSTYVILGEISGALTVPANCTLIFEGGKIAGSLTGNLTTIEAGPVQIFDVGISLSGSFTNEYAYPEWWGEKTEKIVSENLYPDHDYYNCRGSIQAAFDSIFGEIRFCPGFYYIADAVERDNQELALLYLNDTKVIRLSGKSHNYKGLIDDGATSVVWTNQDCNLLLVNILADLPIDMYISDDKVTNVCRPLITGGEFNVSKCNSFSHSAILVYAKGTRGLKVETSVCGPIGNISKSGGVFSWPNEGAPDAEAMSHGYMGYGIKFTHNPTLLDSAGNLISGKTKGICYLTFVDSNIYGFGHGFTVDYSTKAADMTSMELRGYIDNCLRYVYAPSRAFNGGVVESVIQTREHNATDGFAEPIIQGNFTEAYLDPMIWDMNSGIDALELNPGCKKVRLGQRLLGVMRTRFRSYCMGEDVATRETGMRSLAAITSADSGSSMGTFGNFDLLDLSAVNAIIQSANYVHLIDNDLLSIDKMVSDFGINVEQEGFTPKYSSYGGIHKPNTSPFDRGGIVFAFSNQTDNPSSFIRVTLNFPSSCQKPFQFLAFHLKGASFNHFSNLKIEMVNSANTLMTLFDGNYANIQMDDNRSDIILPIIFKDGQYRIAKSLVVTFTGFVYRGDVWGTAGANEDFKFSIEGRYNRHFRHQVFTSGGGAMGNPLTKFGKLYISGTETYPNMSSLPSDAASGALATVGSGTVLTNYPVMKTHQGWMIQGLVGTSQALLGLSSSLGALTVSQQAFDTTLGKPVWWNGTGWVDATGTEQYH